MMKARCNESIKRLITSTEYRFDDGLTVEQRWDQIPDTFLFQAIGEDVQRSGPVIDPVSGEPRKQIKQYSVPFGMLVSVPKSYDPNKTYSFSTDILFSRHEKTELNIRDLLAKNIDISDFHNNLDESILLGRAVYSWVRQSEGNVYLTRETESHLPEGEYVVRLFFGIIDDIFIRTDKYPYYKEEVEAHLITNSVDVHLQLVSKKSGNKPSKKKAKTDNPEESVESLLDEYDNIK